MLLQLRIENLATIKKLEVEFLNGFSILTGETGAGKSIMIDAILIVLGHRSDPDMIRSGEDNAIVEAIFSSPKKNSENMHSEFLKTLEEAGIDIHEELIVRCQISRKGRQKRNINGVSVTIDFLKNIGQKLINIHGQHDNQSLLRVSSHVDFLDIYGNLIPLRKKVEESYIALKASLEELKKFKLKFIELAQREEELNRTINDLTELNFKNGEENELRMDAKKLTHLEKLSEFLNRASFHLNEKDGSILEQLELLRKLLIDSEEFDKECKNIRKGIETIIFQSEDIHQELLKYLSKLEEDPTRLAIINERLSKIQNFTRKFHLKYSEDLTNILESSKKDLENLEHIAENEKEIIERIDSLKKRLIELSLRLSDKRHHIAKNMDKNIVKELHKLGMKKARFETQIITHSYLDSVESYSSKGIDEVKFLMSVNPGQEMRNLSKIASGGELSRIMLAIKTVLTSLDTVEILIFDEIDTGISGAIAEIVGKKLHALGKRHQTLCVTHLAQIAAYADHHYLVKKYQNNNETFTKIDHLDTKNKRVEALANLIGGQVITSQTTELANEMLNNFQAKLLTNIEEKI